MEYVAGFRRHSHATVFGGPIRPWFEGTPPRWLKEGFDQVAGAFAALDLGPEEHQLKPGNPGSLPYGANMAFRSDTLRQLPQAFNPQLGVVGSKRLAGEESDLIDRLLCAGWEGWWLPHVNVKHHIPQTRQTIAFLRRYYVGYGEMLGMLFPMPEGRQFLGRSRWQIRRALELELDFQWRRITRSPSEWLRAFRDASIAWGRLARPCLEFPSCT
jgi:hypothetical protein